MEEEYEKRSFRKRKEKYRECSGPQTRLLENGFFK
jgi:hypothetical protein